MEENVLKKLNEIDVYGNNYGIVGSGNNNTVINFLNDNQTWNLFENFDRCDKNLNEAIYSLLFLDVFNEFSEYIVESIEKGHNNHNKPISVKMSDVIDYCALLLYNNGVTDNEYAWDFIKKLFGTIVMICGWKYEVNIVRVGRNIFFELYESNN